MNDAWNVTYFIILDTPNKIAENLTDFSNIAIAIGHLNPLLTGDKTSPIGDTETTFPILDHFLAHLQNAQINHGSGWHHRSVGITRIGTRSNDKQTQRRSNLGCGDSHPVAACTVVIRESIKF